MAKVTRIKAPATTAPQTRDEAADHIRQIGDLQREQARAQAAMNDAIAAITAQYQPTLAALEARLTPLVEGVQAWCEAHRDELTQGGKTKTANLVTGEIQWRQRPPSVRVRALDTVLETLQRLGLQRFIRTKTEINKEAILAEPAAVEGLAGLQIQTGVEDFVITPFEQQLDAA